MDLVENVRVRKERAEAGFGAEQNCSSAVIYAGIKGCICIPEGASAQGDKLFMQFRSNQIHMRLFPFDYQHFKCTYVQFFRAEFSL